MLNARAKLHAFRNKNNDEIMMEANDAEELDKDNERVDELNNALCSEIESKQSKIQKSNKNEGKKEITKLKLVIDFRSLKESSMVKKETMKEKKSLHRNGNDQ